MPPSWIWRRDLRLVHALAHELEVGTFLAADAFGSMAMRAAALGEQLRAALLCA